MRKRITIWLQNSGQLSFALYAIAAAFLTYFSMYAFRKPFTAALFEGMEIWGIDYKIMAIISQILGYTLSKFLGIKLIAELKPNERIRGIFILMTIAWLALLFFALVPRPWNVFLLFLNGMPLGMIWGVVFSFLEGRRFTELLGAGMASSFIVSSGIVKATGRVLVYTYGLSEFWMPFFTGLIYIPILVLGVFLLSAIPPPSNEDERHRTQRVPMDGRARIRFFSRFSIGISLTVAIYIFLTIFRDIRDNFAVEIWSALGYADAPYVLATAEIPIAIAVLLIISAMIFIKNNRPAFYLNHFLIVFAGFLLMTTTFLFTTFKTNPVWWMILNGFSMYLAYISFHTFLFERWIALFRYKSNIGFLMYIADAFGYSGSVAVLLTRNFVNIQISWFSLFIKLAYITGMATMVLGLLSVVYFYFKEKEELQPESEGTLLFSEA
jgi:hypothetical protein